MSLPSHEQRFLLSYLTGLSKEELFLCPSPDLTTEQKTRLIEWTNRRLREEPLSKIVEEREFWGHRFYTNQDTLDPRPDTETLVQGVIDAYPDPSTPLRILDLGTGTGCLLISLLLHYPNGWGAGIDLSIKALHVAQSNIIRHGLQDRSVLINSHWADALRVFSWDVMVSNPPYISTNTLLPSEVSQYDPHLALFAGKDGMASYHALFQSLTLGVVSETRFFLELGFGQRQDIQGILPDYGWKVLRILRDLSGVERMMELAPIFPLY